MFVVGLVTLPVVFPHQTPHPLRIIATIPDLKLFALSSAAPVPGSRICRSLPRSRHFNELTGGCSPLSFVESTGGKSARHNNLFGWDSGRAHFPTPIAGIHTVGYYLSHSDLYKDKALDKLLATYNPNVEYGRKVKSVMRRIAPSE
jgi:hypothetical protein